MGKSIDSIVALYKFRKEHEAPWRERAMEVRDVYNHEASVPLPELDKREKVFVANLLAQGLDQEAARIASTVPNVVFPPTKIGSKRSQDQAQIRRKALLGWWSQNNMKIKMRRRARWLIGYASAPTWISWDFERGIPKWEIRDPLNTYPAPTNDPDEFCPPNCVFSFTRSYAWLKANYPAQTAGIYTGKDPNPDDNFTLLRYDDADECVLVLLAKTMDQNYRPDWTTGTEPYAELERYENRTGMCLVVEPGRVNLDRPQGQFDGMVGMYQQQAMLQALEVLAVKRSIFPDEWVMGDQQTPQIINTANGLTGEIGVIKGGKLVSNQYVPGPQVPQAIDRLERNQRVEGGIPAEYGGESGSNIRTGRRGDAVLSAAVDFPIQEAQEILAISLQEENRRAIAVAKAYGGNRPQTFWVPWKGVNTRVDYIPNQVFETDENYVAYSHAGADVNSLIIGIGQRIGTGLMSKQTGREIDPLIDDPEMENDRIVGEAIDGAVLAAFASQAQQGAIPPIDAARVRELVVSNKMDLSQAIEQAHKESQERQAAEAPPGAPETQPGLGAPGQGAEQPTIPDQRGGAMGNLAMLLNNLRRPQMQGSGEALGEQALQGQGAA